MGEVAEGTISQGTLRTDDLVTAFTGELERLSPKAADEIRREYADVYAWLDREKDEDEILNTFGDAPVEIQDQALYLTLEILPDSLDREAPEGMVFAAHPGDGSDFGFWREEPGE